jgi:hypothetical protein
MDLLYFNLSMLLSFNFYFLILNISRSFSFKIKIHNSIIYNFSPIHYVTIYVMKAQKSFRVIFAKSKLIFCFLLSVKRFKKLFLLKNPLFSIQISVF